MRIKTVVTLMFVVIVGVVGMNAPAIASNDTSWIPNDSISSEPTTHSFVFADKLALPFLYSVLEGNSSPDMYLCTSTSDPACERSPYFTYNSILKVCTNSSDTNCVDSVSSVDATGNSSQGKFVKYTVANHLNSYPADNKIGIPAGDVPGIWSIPSAPHSSGDQYAVIAGLDGNVDRSGRSTVTGGFIQLSLVPVVLKDFGNGRSSQDGGWTTPLPGIFYDYCTEFQQSPTNKNVNCGHVNGNTCLLPTNDQGLCYAEEPFGNVQRFNLKLKLAKEPTGWMHGRMVDPSITVSTDPSGNVSLSVTAGATSVPMVYQSATWVTEPSSIKDLWVKCFNGQRYCGSSVTRGQGATSEFNDFAKTLDGNSHINLLTYVNAFGPIPLKIAAEISPLVGDKSVALSTTWSMRTLSNLEMNGANNCFTSTPGLKGIVTTNSTAYSAGPPEFNNGSLNYQVASPHFNPDGTTPFKGNYNLVMRSDVARCIYGFTKAPIKASISILSSDGANDVATTVANEKDGWLSLSANNFQFSSPTIQVKLSQDAPAPVAAPTPIATPKPDPSASLTPVATPVPVVAPVVVVKKTSITCVKGKITKTVTAVKPICPTGYKKK